MSGKKILVVEDEEEIRELVGICLQSHKFETVFADDGIKALELFEREQPDLVLLDILIPKVDGLRVCEEIRKYSNVPIIFMSCKKDSADIIRGLELGGDDYVTKPFDLNVLAARIHSNMRRAPIFNRSLLGVGEALNSGRQVEPDVLHYDGIEINLLKNEVKVDNIPVCLSLKEIQLLTLLVGNPNQTFSTEELYKKVWGVESAGDTRTVNVHISNIRKKIEPDPAYPKYLQNIRGCGYRFVKKDN